MIIRIVRISAPVCRKLAEARRVVKGMQPDLDVSDFSPKLGERGGRPPFSVQRAMARAMLKPDASQGKRSDLDTSFLSKEVDVSAAYLSKARFILRHDEQLAQSAATANSALASPNPTPCRFSNMPSWQVYRVNMKGVATGTFQIHTRCAFQPYDLSVRLTRFDGSMLHSMLRLSAMIHYEPLKTLTIQLQHDAT